MGIRIELAVTLFAKQCRFLSCVSLLITLCLFSNLFFCFFVHVFNLFGFSFLALSFISVFLVIFFTFFIRICLIFNLNLLTTSLFSSPFYESFINVILDIIAFLLYSLSSFIFIFNAAAIFFFLVIFFFNIDTNIIVFVLLLFFVVFFLKHFVLFYLRLSSLWRSLLFLFISFPIPTPRLIPSAFRWASFSIINL